MADPAPIADAIKAAKSRWPKLFAHSETDPASDQAHPAAPATSATSPCTRSAEVGAGGRGAEAQCTTPETDSASAGGGRAGTEAQRATIETRAASADTFSQERRSPISVDGTRAAEGQTGAEGTGTRLQKPLTERLVALFGKGDNPSLRMTLYFRIQFTVQNFGRDAELVLRDVIDAAKTKRNPGNYFAFSIVRRFRENGFFRED